MVYGANRITITHLRNDAVLDKTFSKDEAASFLYYLYCN